MKNLDFKKLCTSYEKNSLLWRENLKQLYLDHQVVWQIEIYSILQDLDYMPVEVGFQIWKKKRCWFSY